MRDKAASRSAENKTEVNMKLNEILADNPAAKAEHEAALKQQYDAGVEATKKAQEETINGLEPFLKSGAYMGKTGIQKGALMVLKGESDIATFKMAVAMQDEGEEKKNSDAAITETEEVGETKPETMESKEVAAKSYQASLKKYKRGN